MLYFENEQLEMKESIMIFGIIGEVEKYNKLICDEIFVLNFWGRKWNFIVYGIFGEIKEIFEMIRYKI